jgi:putative peptide zinc metalloprotease protein
MQANRLAMEAVIARDLAVPYRRVRDLVISKRDTPAGSSPIYFVKTAAKQVYQLGQEEHLLCALLDGKRPFAELQSEFKRQIGGELTREQFDGLLTELLECGIVEPDQDELNQDEQDIAGHSVEDGVVEDGVVENESVEDELALADEFDDFATTADDQPVPGAARDRFALRLFNPAALLQALDWLGGPLRFYQWLLLPVAFGCLIKAATSADAITATLSSLAPAGAVAFVAAALLVVSVVPVLAQAVMASFLGYPAPACGIELRFRCLPRLCFLDAEWGDLSAARALTLTAAPLTALLALFAASMATWLATQHSGGWLPGLALIMGVTALCGVLASATPFAATAGRKWLTTLFGLSDLWRVGGSYRAHLLALSGLWGLACLGVVLFCLNTAAHAGAFGPTWHGVDTGPVGTNLDRIVLPLLTIVPLASWIWLRGMVKSSGTSHVVFAPYDRLPGGPGSAAPPPGGVVPFDRQSGQSLVPGRRQAQAEPWHSAKTVVVLATILALLGAIGLVPYPYEAGGNFTILPHDSSKLNARIGGELTEVLINEGDWVKPGQIVGILSDWDQQANLAVAKAQLENAKASLQALYETPKPEDLELARTQYELAVSKLPYDKAQYERAAVLVKTDAVSRSNYDQIVSQYQQDQAAAEVARANYEDVRTGPTPGQLDAARALVRQYAATVAYNEDQLERTRIRATAYGSVVTPNPMLLRGQWFTQGQLVFTVQDLRTVQADVQVPETDIGHVQLGGNVRLRPLGYPEITFPGTAMAIAGDAQPDPGGSGTNIIRVRADIPNPDGALHPTMTGYAKLTGLFMPTWQAFMQMIIRFFMITIWSFIP